MSTHLARLTRRTFVVRGTWAAVAATGVGILAACSPTAPGATSGGTPQSAAPGTAQPAAGGKLQLPTFVPPKGPTPDVPGTDTIPNGFVSYPKSPTQSVASPPGDGGTLTVAGEVFTSLIGIDQNTLWQQLNKAMNINLQLNLAPFSD